MIRRAAAILDQAKRRASRLKSRAFALAPWAAGEAEAAPVAERERGAP